MPGQQGSCKVGEQIALVVDVFDTAGAKRSRPPGSTLSFVSKNEAVAVIGQDADGNPVAKGVGVDASGAATAVGIVATLTLEDGVTTFADSATLTVEPLVTELPVGGIALGFGAVSAAS